MGISMKFYKKFLNYKLILLSGLIFCNSLIAIEEENIILLQPDTNVLEVTNQAYIFVDEDKKFKIEDLITFPDSKFKHQKNLNFGMSKKAFWLKLDIKSINNENDWLLEIGHPVLDHVELYSPDENGNYSVMETGDALPFHSRKVKQRTFAFDIHAKADTVTTYYLRVTSESTISIPLKIWNEKAMAENRADEQIIFGLYYGLILAMGLYNIFLFIYVRDLSYMYYVLYIVTFGLLQMSLNGLAFQYLWPNSTWLASYAPTFLIPGFVIFIIQFTRHFILSYQNTPRLDKVFKFLFWVGAVLTINSMMLPISSILWVIVVYCFITLTIVIGAAIRAWWKGYKPATYYLISWGGIFIGGFLYGFKSIGILPNIFITSYGLQIGAAMEVILLSVALAARINIMKKEKEEAQKYAIEMQTLLATSYARFVPKEFLSNLGKNSILDVKLGDQVAKEMTVMFSDIRSFTELSEKMTPEENFNFINSYLSRMSPIIQTNKGYIDKFMGDAIMALFEGIPDSAVHAAIQMQKHIAVYNLHRHNQGYKPIQIGIGMHTGKLMLGTIGGSERMEGTVISDSVNLGSRIEGLTKIYGVKIAASEKTFNSLKSPGDFHFRFLDRVQVKGKSQSTLVYEIFDGDNDTIFELKFKTKNLFERGIDFYYSQKFKEARECFTEIIQIFPDDKVSNIYVQRSDYYMNNPIGSNWEGVSILTEK